MVRYLHEKLGYNVILYETGLYDMYLMNQDGRQRMNPSKLYGHFGGGVMRQNHYGNIIAPILLLPWMASTAS